MKKLLAVLLVMSMVLVMFAACGSKTTEETTTAEETTAEEVVDTEAAADEAVAEDETAAPAEDADTTAADGETTAADGETTAADGETTTAKEEVSVPSTTEEIVAYYNAARKASKDSAPKGYQTMALNGDITGDGAFGTIASALSSTAQKVLANNSKETDWIPAADHADIKASDVTSATAKADKNGNIVVTLKFKDQTDGPDGDSNNGGPVARGVGTLGSIDEALSQLGVTFEEGRDTVKLHYTNAQLTATIKDGKIISGDWKYSVKVSVADAKAKLSVLSAHVKNLAAQIDYEVKA